MPAKNKSNWKLRDGELDHNIIISQILVEKDHKIDIDFINENIIDQNAIEIMTLQQSHGWKTYGNCPNLRIGFNKTEFSEKFIFTNSVPIQKSDSPYLIKSSTTESSNKKINLSLQDITNLKYPKINGPLSSIHFLEDYDNLEIIDVTYKDCLVVKVQERDFTKKDKIGYVNRAAADRCYGYSELVRLMQKKIYRSDQKEFSGLYQTHFYALSKSEPKKFDLYIVLEKCQIIVSDLIKKVHKLNPNLDQKFTTTQKMPTSVLISLCKLFFDENGENHNDLKPQNIGFTVENGKIMPRYIDLGSASEIYSKEPEGVSTSVYPSTILYLSCNKVPDFDSSWAQNSEDSTMKTVTTTDHKAKPNYNAGWGDNMWANAMTLLEMMFGQHPALINGVYLASILKTLKELDFYNYFIESEIYKNHYEKDKEFEPVRRFLKLGLERDPKKRENTASLFDDGNDSTGFYVAEEIFQNIKWPSTLKEDLSSYYNFSDLCWYK